MAVRKTPGVFFLITLIVCLVSGCDDQPEVVRIGFTGPFEGPYRDYGTQVISGVRYALDELNSEDRHRTFMVELIAFNDYGITDKAIDVSYSLTTDEYIDIIIDSWCTETSEDVIKQYSDYGKLVIGLLPECETGNHRISMDAAIIDDFLKERYPASSYLDRCGIADTGRVDSLETLTPVLCEPEIFFTGTSHEEAAIYILGFKLLSSDSSDVTGLQSLGDRGPFFMQGYLGARYAVALLVDNLNINANSSGYNEDFKINDMIMEYYWTETGWELLDITHG